MRTLLIASMVLGISAAVPVMAAEGVEEQPIEEEEIIIQGRRNLSRQVKNGFAAFRDGNFEKAESYFYRVRAGYMLQSEGLFAEFSGIGSFGTFSNVGSVYSSTQDHEVRRALAIIMYMEGMSQRGQGRHMSARRSFLNVLRVNPKHFDARADLALIEIERGKAESSVRHIERLARDFGKCDAKRYEDTCPAIQERLLEVEQAYGRAVSG